MLRDCPTRGHRFLPGIPAFSSGTVAMPGHEIVHDDARHAVALAGRLRPDRAPSRGGNRPKNGLCGIELRSRAVHVRGLRPVQRGLSRPAARLGHPPGHEPHPRTNVAPVAGGPSSRASTRSPTLRPAPRPPRRSSWPARARCATAAGLGGHRPSGRHLARGHAREGEVRDGHHGRSPGALGATGAG